MNEEGARYLLVGGYAVAFHAEPRWTKDLDVWVDCSPENAQRVHAALRKFGAPIQNLTADDLTRSDLIFQMGIVPNRIDILTGMEGIGFSEAWASGVEAHYGDVAIHVIGKAALVLNKRAVGRPQDLRDVEALERGSESRPAGGRHDG
ncbi:MAG: hypothetical protein HZA54_11880 [Planctomycetes bacterium]|nr:hypothetical protein [Planctomycetota bacterium]